MENRSKSFRDVSKKKIEGREREISRFIKFMASRLYGDTFPTFLSVPLASARGGEKKKQTYTCMFPNIGRDSKKFSRSYK